MKRIYKYLLVLAAFAAYAPISHADDRPKGVQLNKTVTKTNKQTTDGKDIYTLTLESYVNGENTKTAPADVVLVLDVSGSMVDAFGNNTYTAINKKTLSWAELQNKRYYIYYRNNYYAIYRYIYNEDYEDYYYFSIYIGDTKYYLDEDGDPHQNLRYDYMTESETANILTNATIYEGSHQANNAAGETVTVGASRLDALQHAVGIFIDKMDQGSRVDANGQERDVPIDNQIAIVKFAGSNSTGTDSQRGVSKSVGNDIIPYTAYNYTQVRTIFTPVAPSKTSSNAESLKSDINSLFAGGATNTNDGLTLGRNLFNGRPAANKKTLVLFTDGASNQANSAKTTATAIKNAGITIYTVGVFDGNENDDFMKSIASGDDHYFKPTSPESLNEIFAAIAEQSGADVDVKEPELKDEVTHSFDVNGEISTEGDNAAIRIYTQKYIGQNQWSTAHEEATGVTLNTVETEDEETGETTTSNRAFTVTGFDYNANWVGIDQDYQPSEANYYHGRKLVIEVDIVIDDDAVGGKHVNTNTPESGLYYSPDQFEPFPVPNLSIPITIQLKKYGLRNGESAVFSIYRLPDEEGKDDDYYKDKSNYPSQPYMQINVTGSEELSDDKGTYVIKMIKNLDPNYVYMLWEQDWTWSYQTQDENGQITTRGAEINPFVITNLQKDTDEKYSEAKVINNFKTNTKTVIVKE